MTKLHLTAATLLALALGIAGTIRPLELTAANNSPRSQDSNKSFGSENPSIIPVTKSKQVRKVTTRTIAPREPRSIRVMTKFVEVNQENGDELDFDWIEAEPFITHASNE